MIKPGGCACNLDCGYLCPGYKKFFAHALPEIRRIVGVLRQQRPQPRKRM
jgi:sulfatase maturation enzyme AslB (radical SAM superfamily)